MKKVLIVLAMLISGKVLAQETNEANQRISVYLHPISLIASLGTDEFPVLLYLTGEFPMSGTTSLIVAPSLWAGKAGEYDHDYLRIGSGVGIRYFANGNSEGFYLQAMPSFHYLSTEDVYVNGATDEVIYRENVSGFIVDILGYIGYSAKYAGISMFIDVGIGYGHIDVDTDSDILLNGLTADINLGLGIPF